MDLDEFRHALGEAGSLSEIDVVNAREDVGARARRHRRRQRSVASLLVLSCTVAVIVAVPAMFGSRNTHDSVTVTPATQATSPTSATTTTPVTPTFSYLYLYPFASLADAQAWQRAYGSGGHQPWHLDAGMTATSLADFLGYAMVDQVISIHTDASGAHVALGYHNPNGVPMAAATVHLVRVGTGSDAPWEVVGNDQSSTFTLATPGYGATVSSPVHVAGTITGVDENIRVGVYQQSSNAPVGAACCRAAGGVTSPWSITVRFADATGPVLVISASTGGHLQKIERFVFTAIRRGG
jgi:hypothetical protein